MLARARTAALLAACAVSGCVSLDVSHVTADGLYKAEGYQYALPFVQFDLVATRTFDSCKDGALKIKYGVTFTLAAVPDPTQTYVIDHRSLASIMKNSDLKVAISGGMLTSINSSAQDQSGPVIQGVVSSLGQIAATIATGGLPVPAPTGGGGPRQPPSLPQGGASNVSQDICDGLLSSLLTAQKEQKKRDAALDSATAKLKVATARLSALTSVGAMGGRPDSATQSKLVSAADAVASATAVQTEAATAAADNQKIFTDVESFRMPASGKLEKGGAVTVQIPVGDSLLTKWTKPGLNRSFFTVSVRLEPVPGASLPPPHKGLSDVNGIAYRVPGRGRLVVCNTEPAKTDKGTVPTHEKVQGMPVCGADEVVGDMLPPASTSIWEGAVPQFGYVMRLPYSNKMFQNNVLSATFGSDGSLITGEYQAQSAAQAAATTLQQVASTAQATASAVTQAELVRLQYQTSLATAQANLATARGAVLVAPVTAQANLQTALNNVATAQGQALSINAAAQAAQVAAQTNLVTAQSAATVAQQVGLLQANTSLASAQTAYNNAQITLLTSQSSLKAATLSAQ